MDNDTIDILTPKLIAGRPNTYTYTKALAEYLLVEEGHDLPIAVIRPSIVGSSLQEPFEVCIDVGLELCLRIKVNEWKQMNLLKNSQQTSK